jgi:hypothetical protein
VKDLFAQFDSLLRRCRKCHILYFLGYNSHEDICLACAQEEKK